MLLTLEDQVGTPAEMSAAELLAVSRWVSRGRPGRPPGDTAEDPVLSPEVNHGRWIVRCPFCPSANRASRLDRRFLCCDCWNAPAGGLWLPVEWPEDADAIETALLARPDRHTRHWRPGETVAHLDAENEVHR